MDFTMQKEVQKNGAARKEEARELRAAVPAVDVHSNADGVLVLADLPGVKAEDLSLYLDKDALTLKAERKAGPRPVLYKRTFHVPGDLDGDAIEAKLEGGVLSLKIPRRASAKPRQIPVK